MHRRDFDVVASNNSIYPTINAIIYKFEITLCKRLPLVVTLVLLIRESPPQFENRIMARVYVRSITRSTMYHKARTGVWKISSVTCRFSSIKIDYSDYSKSLLSRLKEVYVFFSIKYRYSDILLKKHKLHLSRLFCCNHTCHCVNMVSVT